MVYLLQLGTIDLCYNSGTVTGSGNFIGGIVGSGQSASKITMCNNSGKVTGKYNVGGICGCMPTSSGVNNSILEKSYNSGDIEGVQAVGGLVGSVTVGSSSVTVLDCYNKGKMVGTTNTGEIIGNLFRSEGAEITINKLFYLKNTSGLTAIGGEEDNATNKIMGVTDNLSYEQFKTWITSQ